MWGRLICLYVLSIFPSKDLDAFGEAVNNICLPSPFLYKVNKAEEPAKRGKAARSIIASEALCSWKKTKSWEKCYHSTY